MVENIVNPARSRPEDRVVEICRDLIRIDTTNRGGNVSVGEPEAAALCARLMEEAGMRPRLFESSPGRVSVVGHLPGWDEDAPGLVVHGHTDVVPAEADEWSVDPFGAELKDGMIWGRGAVDIKDMDAMILSVVRHMVRTGQKPKRDIMLGFFAERGGDPDRAGKRDPLDCLVMARWPFMPGCVVRARPIAVLFLEDEAGGDEKLLAVPVEQPPGKQTEPVKLADQVGDYVLSPDSKRVAYQVRTPTVSGMYDLYLADLPELKGRKVASGTTAFAFSPDAKWLARNDGGKPEVLGDLYVGPASGEPARKVGERVKEAAFSPDSQALGFLAKYDQSAGAGLMGVVALPDGEPKLVGSRVPNFTWGKDGKYVAFLSRFLKPIYSVDLMLYQVGAEKAEKAHPGVFGYGFAPGALVFRAGCIREGRACDFKALPLPKQEQAQPQTWMQGIYSYKLSEDGNRILATSARMDSDTFDVAIYDVKTQARKTLDQGALLPAYFAGQDDSLAVYVRKGANAGVYVAPAQP